MCPAADLCLAADPSQDRAVGVTAAGGITRSLRVLGSVGGTGEPAPDEFGMVPSVAVGPDGDVWVADAMNRELRVFAPDGSLLVIAGATEGPDAAENHAPVDFLTAAYDPAADEWIEMASLPTPISHITSSTFNMNGRIVVAGGDIAYRQGTNVVSAYSPSSNTWAELNSLPATRIAGGLQKKDSSIPSRENPQDYLLVIGTARVAAAGALCSRPSAAQSRVGPQLPIGPHHPRARAGEGGVRDERALRVDVLAAGVGSTDLALLGCRLLNLLL